MGGTITTRPVSLALALVALPALPPTAAEVAQVLALRPVAPADPLAVCQDGVTKPHYYSVAPRTPEAADHWQVILFGPQNGWPTCFPPPDSGATAWDNSAGAKYGISNCYWGDMTKPAPPPPPPPPNTTVLCTGACLYSGNCTLNPTLCNYGKVMITPCNGDAWFGDTVRTFGSAPISLHFRGQRVLWATLTQVAMDIGLSSSSTVLMMGQEASGNALYTYADRIGAFFAEPQHGGVPPANYRVVVVEGFWPRWSGYYSGDTLAQVIAGQGAPIAPGSQNSATNAPHAGGNAYDYMNFSHAVNPACVAGEGLASNASNTWQCLLAENALKYIDSKIFALERAWGTFGSFCLVNGVIANDPVWHGWYLGCDPRCAGVGCRGADHLHICVEYGWKCSSQYMDMFVKPYQQNILAEFQATKFLAKPGNGAFMHSCHTGDEDNLGDGSGFFQSIQVGGRSAQETLLQWVMGKPMDKSRFDPPCLWNQSAHAPFQNSCNPTCVRCQSINIPAVLQ